MSLAGAGTQTAGLAFGGYSPGVSLAATEEYDGSSWTAGGSLNTAKKKFRRMWNANSSTCFWWLSRTLIRSSTELYNGTSWTTSPATLATARSGLRGAGTQTAGLAFGGYSH
jgi:hypothetical protein